MTDWLDPEQVKEWLKEVDPQSSLDYTRVAMEQFVRAISKLPRYEKRLVPPLYEQMRDVWSVDHVQVRDMFEVARIIVEALDGSS